METLSESQLENDLRELISNGHSLSSVCFISPSHFIKFIPCIHLFYMIKIIEYDVHFRQSNWWPKEHRWKRKQYIHLPWENSRRKPKQTIQINIKHACDIISSLLLIHTGKIKIVRVRYLESMKVKNKTYPFWHLALTGMIDIQC